MKCPFCNKSTASEARLCVHCGKDIRKNLSKQTRRSFVCPICEVDTSIINLAGVELDFCHECSGIWFDKREMKQFLKVISSKESADKICSILNDMALGKERRPRNAYLKCPVCNELMIQRNYLEISGILLDQCLQHGTWADRQDLINLLDLISTGDLEELIIKSSNRQFNDLEKRMNNIELDQAFIGADIARLERNQKAHLALNLLGIL